VSLWRLLSKPNPHKSATRAGKATLLRIYARLDRIGLIRFRTILEIGAVVIYTSPQFLRNTRWTCRARLVEPENVLSRDASRSRVDEVKPLRCLAFRADKLSRVFTA